MRRRKKLDYILSKFPYLREIIQLLDACGYEPGHYYSPIPNLMEITKRKDSIFKKNIENAEGINFEKENQFKLLENFENYYQEIPYDFEGKTVTNTRYQVQSAWYRYSDVIMLYSIMRHYEPSRIIEVGSGYSSAVMIDTNEMFLGSKASIRFIDPFPQRLNQFLGSDTHKNYHVLVSKVQEVDYKIFLELKANDILFIDSSHVSKIGSDLNFVLFEIMPVLKTGVLIHFHDIFYPFELLEHWILEKKWFWNENYLIRAYLTENNKYRIINFNTYLQKEFREWFKIHMPFCLLGEEDTGSIWLQKI